MSAMFYFIFIFVLKHYSQSILKLTITAFTVYQMCFLDF